MKVLIALFLIAILGIIGNYLPVIDGFEKITQYYDTAYNLSLGYIVAFIFYVIVNFIPEYKAKKHIETFEREMLFKIRTSLSVLLGTITNYQLKFGISESLDQSIAYDEMKDALSKIYVSNYPKTICVHYGKRLNILEIAFRSLKRIENLANRLQRHLIFLDTKGVHIINKILNNPLFEIWETFGDKEEFVFENKIFKSEEESLKIQTSRIYRLYVTYIELNNYLLKRYKNCAENIPIFRKNEDHKKIVKITKKLLKNDKHNSQLYTHKYQSELKLEKYSEALKTIDKVLFLCFYHSNEQLLQSIEEEYPKVKEYEHFKSLKLKYAKKQ